MEFKAILSFAAFLPLRRQQTGEGAFHQTFVNWERFCMKMGFHFLAILIRDLLYVKLSKSMEATTLFHGWLRLHG